jgi:hypothetical protein
MNPRKLCDEADEVVDKLEAWSERMSDVIPTYESLGKRIDTQRERDVLERAVEVIENLTEALYEALDSAEAATA